MSLEEALAANTAAINAQTEQMATLTDIMVKHNSLIGNLSGRLPGAAAKTEAGTNTGDATTATKTETAAQKKKREKDEAEAAAKAAADAAKNTKTVTIETLRTSVGEWLGSSAKGSEELAEKRAALKRILDHFGKEKITDLPEDKLVEFDGYMEQVKNGEDPLPEDGAGEGDDPLL